MQLGKKVGGGRRRGEAAVETGGCHRGPGERVKSGLRVQREEQRLWQQDTARGPSAHRGRRELWTVPKLEPLITPSQSQLLLPDPEPLASRNRPLDRGYRTATLISGNSSFYPNETAQQYQGRSGVGAHR